MEKPLADKGKGKRSTVLLSMLRWFDSDAAIQEADGLTVSGVDWVRVMPFLVLHVSCLLVFVVGWSWTAVAVAAGLYLARMFAITGFYHRYFSHRAFKTNRFWQFLFAVAGNASVQRGPLWWAAHHRHHHRFADRQEDAHSPSLRGFWWSHMGWIMSSANFPTKRSYVKDWLKYPELVWLNRFDTMVPLLLALSLYLLGEMLASTWPELNTNGLQLLVWGFVVSTVALFHGTFTINSLDHMIGSRRYNTGDTSRNNAVLAVITLGEGWHNNHHHYPISARQGFFWWEIDVTYYVLRIMAFLGIVKELRPVPEDVRKVLPAMDVKTGRGGRQGEEG
jgi:stearoyl-CoA desaturase (delta-9 desaturase)